MFTVTGSIIHQLTVVLSTIRAARVIQTTWEKKAAGYETAALAWRDFNEKVSTHVDRSGDDVSFT